MWSPLTDKAVVKVGLRVRSIHPDYVPGRIGKVTDVVSLRGEFRIDWDIEKHRHPIYALIPNLHLYLEYESSVSPCQEFSRRLRNKLPITKDLLERL